MSSHPILTASFVAGALAAGGLAIAASRDSDSPPRARDTNAGSAIAPATIDVAQPAPRATRSDRAALLAQIRAARARKTSITAAGALPPVTRPLTYDFSGETLTAGVTPKPPSTKPHTVLNKTAIRDSLTAARADVLACYESALTRTPDLAGTLTIRLVVEGEPDIGGMISDVSTDAENSTITDSTLSTCVLDAISSIDLPAPDEGTELTIYYPYTFARR